MTGLTANRLISSNADKTLVSSDLYSWVTETSNQVLIADDGDGTITLSTPQDIHTAATPTFAGLTLSSIANETTDVDKFLVDSSGVIKYRTGAEVLSDIGSSGSSHLHDGDTLQHDAVNSNGGAFSFTTTGLVTFNQSIASANYTAANLLTACATNAGAVDFSAASKTLTVEDDTVVSQDYSADAIPIFAGLTPNADDANDFGIAVPSTPDFSLDINQTLSSGSSSITGTSSKGATFTPGEDYDLGRVSFWMRRNGPGEELITLHVSATTAGLPSGEDLATKEIDGSGISDSELEWVDFTLDSPLSLTGGQKYAVWPTVTTHDSSFVIGFKNSDEYAGGNYLQGIPWSGVPTYDLTVRIYKMGEVEYTYTRWQNLYLSGVLHDGTVSLSVANAKAAYDFTTALNAATDGQLMIGSTGANPVLAALTGTANQIIVTPGAGSVTLSTPQDIHTGASPTFAGATFTQVVTGIDPVNSNHLATKEYVDSAISFINDFFLTDDASIGGYFDAAESPTGAATGTLTTTGLTEGDDKPLDGFITESGFPGVTVLSAGVYNIHLHVQRSAGNRDYTLYFELWTRTDPGGTETLRTTSETSANFDDDNERAINIHATLASDIVINATDRLVWKLFANMGVGNNTDLGILTEGVTNSHVSVPTTVEILSSVFVRQDGTKALTGPWDMGSQALTNVNMDSGNIAVAVVNTEWDAAYNHSQLSSGNPHSVTPTELSLVIGTNVQAHGDVLDDLNTLGAVISDGQFIVGTGAGTFAYESGTTIRTSLGLGTGDTPEFTSLDIGSTTYAFSSIQATGSFAIKTSGDNSDYLYISTVSDVPIISTVGDCDLKITSSSGEIDFDNENLTTIGTITSGVITQGGTTLANTYQPLDAELTSLAGLTYAAASFVKMTGANAFALRTIGETADDLEGTIVHDNLASVHQGVATGDSPTFAGVVIADGGTIGQSAGPLLTFNDTDNDLGITGCHVGIGTNTPAFALHIAAPSAEAILIMQRTNATSNGSKGIITFADSNGYYVASMEAIADGITDNSGDFLFRASSGQQHTNPYSAAPRMVLKANGKIGIGTVNPKTKLTVEGTITLKEQATADGDSAGYGQLWCKDNAGTTELWFTNDSGTDTKIV